MSKSASVRPLSPRLQEIAREELNEDPKRTPHDLAHLKAWLKKQPHLQTARTDDQWLLTFLRGCKFSLEKTKEKLDTYYTMRTMAPEFFNNRDPMLPEIQQVLKFGTFLLLPLKDASGCKVGVNRGFSTDPSTTKLETTIKLAFMCMDILIMEEDDSVVKGYMVVCDIAGASMGHIVHLTPSLLKKTMTCMQDAYPVRLQGLHYVNHPPITQTLINMCLSLLKPKLVKRVNGHLDLDSLYSQVSQKILPKEYGGEGGTAADIADYWKTKVESYREWFLEDEKRKSDETKRLERPDFAKNKFGVEGSFRQLHLD